MSDRRVGVFGQPVLDRYLFGVTHRISREAPVLIVREESEALSLGGAGNTAANLAGLGARAALLGPIGEDREAELLRQIARERAIDTHGLISGSSPVTHTKTRVLAGGLHTTRQQMLRIDRETDAPPSEAAKASLLSTGRALLGDLDAVIIADYGAGTLAPVWSELGRDARDRGLPVVVDSRHALLQFEGVTAVTPNEPEAELALGRRLGTREEAERASTELLRRLGLEATLLTRGREGMVVARRGGPPVHLDAWGGEAVDVTGAGDTVAAAFTLGLAAGADVVAAARLANAAASVVVQKTGTVPIRGEELREALAGRAAEVAE
jgi:rfaE bifunctional protein kinase chain/domain